ncbi:acyl carrier protein [Brenneria rubrifaciens]|uniref:Acyl carrier protein n=1 Tax=Brenneria rubrifaciens TaxID=55213 RepID=A0A4V1F9Q3_9GAMM|nr:phosphopantetheine-binding protein [Brenneria rubrifaciens]QCR08373.1 acyl carrier protein [Brenneria rubrifaciens]
MDVFNFLKEQIIELTDTDEDILSVDMELDTIGLVSLDYISIQVALKRMSGVNLELKKAELSSIKTLGDLVGYIEAQCC